MGAGEKKGLIFVATMKKKKSKSTKIHLKRGELIFSFCENTKSNSKMRLI